MPNPDLQNIFKETYDATADAIFRYCCARVSDREIARDLTQESFVRLWKSMQEGKDISHPKSFLFTVANHLVIDWYRKKKPFSLESLMGEEEDDDTFLADEKAYERLGVQAEGRYLLGMIGKLGAYSQIIYLRFIEDMPLSEIAKTLGISSNAASVRINRGIEKLRRLAGYDIPDDDHENT